MCNFGNVIVAYRRRDLNMFRYFGCVLLDFRFYYLFKFIFWGGSAQVISADDRVNFAEIVVLVVWSFHMSPLCLLVSTIYINLTPKITTIYVAFVRESLP